MGFQAVVKRLEVPFEGGTLPNRWINNDIKPIESARRTWNFWSFHNLWVTINVNITVYMLGSSMVAIGLTWWQSIICNVIGSLLIMAFVIPNSMTGAFYHIGFPVANRYSWGMYGSQFVVWNRILLSLVWYAIQAWIGGQCIYVCLQAIWPNLESLIPNHLSASSGMTTAQFVAYIVFMVASLPLIWIRPHKLKPFFWTAAVVEVVFLIILLIWALATMGPNGFNSNLAGKEVVHIDNTGWTMVYAFVSCIGSVSAGVLNQNDYARFAKKPRNVIYAQAYATWFYWLFASTIGILVTSATQDRYGGPIWNLPTLLSTIIQTGGARSRAAAFFAGLAIIVSQFGINIPGNALSGGFDFAATFPRFINIRRGAYLTALLSIAVNPWQLLSSASTFLNVMSSYGVFLGPMCAIMITSYYITHRQKLNVDDLYTGTPSSIYWHTYGVNWRAVVAWCAGVAPSMPGFIAAVNTAVTDVPLGLRRLYYINFLTGFAVTGIVYVGLHRVFPARRLDAFVRSGMSRDEVVQFYCEKWDRVAVEGEGEGVAVVESEVGSEGEGREKGRQRAGVQEVSVSV